MFYAPEAGGHTGAAWRSPKLAKQALPATKAKLEVAGVSGLCNKCAVFHLEEDPCELTPRRDKSGILRCSGFTVLP